MGLFHKQQPKTSNDDGAVDAEQEQHFFDEYYREELRNHGRWYFEKVIDENGALFKQDLDATIGQVKVELKEHITKQLDEAIAQVNIELKDHATKQLDDQFAQYTNTMKEAQDQALQAMNASSQALREQHEQLGKTLQQNIAEQESLLHGAFEDNKARISAMKDAQDVALKSLTDTAQSLQEHYEQLHTALAQKVADEEAALIKQFEDNMAQIVEHYLLGAFGDQYDLKAQLPSIIKQLEANKQAMADDIKL
jgi:hypothetical protein